MFNQLGWGELTAILLLALFVFGPERLPGLAQDAGRTLRQVRNYLRGVTDDIKTELGPEVGDLDLASLHPKRFVADLMKDDDDDGYDPLPTPPGGRLLAAGERPPWDPDTT